MLNLCHHLYVRELQTIQLHRSSLGTRYALVHIKLVPLQDHHHKAVVFFQLGKTLNVDKRQITKSSAPQYYSRAVKKKKMNTLRSY